MLKILAFLITLNTKQFVISWCAIPLIWEAWTFVNKTDADTISEIVWEWAKHLLIVRFVIAFLFAHLFFQRAEEAADGRVWQFIKKYPVNATIMGLLCGYLYWQRAPRLAKSTTK
jgi:hypothetical protein